MYNLAAVLFSSAFVCICFNICQAYYVVTVLDLGNIVKLKIS